MDKIRVTRPGCHLDAIPLALALTAGWFSSTLWNPVTVRDLKASVEEFDHAEFSSASWQQWHVPAEWLKILVLSGLRQAAGISSSRIGKGESQSLVLCHAIESGLLQGADLERVPDLDGMRKRAFDTLQKIGHSSGSVTTSAFSYMRW